ncbi:unnamed protein product [Brassica rapa]|uniref:Protein kinase domain-containing protein n=2 Tax=Brassica campestris TaxID=3711 RepID=A0A8D9DJF5_BRACM|nr:unnamed protein product [Brassica rapa]
MIFCVAMEKHLCGFPLLLLVLLLSSIDGTTQLQSSQSQTLLRLQQLLYYPKVLTSWNNFTDFCNSEPNSSLTVVCYEDTLTQLHITGDRRGHMLPKSFSIDSFVTTLAKLPDVKVLTLVSLGLWGRLPEKINRLSSLEIFNVSSNFLFGPVPHELSSLASLQTLILDENMFSGHVPDWIGSLPSLAVLSLRKNAFNGSLPSSLSTLSGLRVLSLANNRFSGALPDLSRLTNLQVLDLESNSFGPMFPRLSHKLVTIILSKNMFRSAVSSQEVSSLYQLQHFDLSFNTFVGPFPTSLMSLPAITYLNISHNKLTGRLSTNLSCNSQLISVDLSSNLLTGSLPDCLKPSSKTSRDVVYGGNCLANANEDQRPVSFCSNEALAVGILPQRRKRVSKLGVALGVTGGVLGLILLAGAVFVVLRRVSAKRKATEASPRLIKENVSMGYTSKLLSDARYISQTMKLGALGLPAYRTFSLEELEYATNNFESSAFMGEGSQGQIYRGRLKDGSFVAIRCLKMKKSCSTQNLMHHIELIAKLRHRHLVSVLGHCFECYLDDSTVSRMFFVFEYVPNGELRSWISDGNVGRLLTWEQRISVAIGVAKGIQFLHTGIVPGVYDNNLRITDVLLDSNLAAKISSYNLPLLVEGLGKVGQVVSRKGTPSIKDEDKVDIYDFGVILLELIVGRPLKAKGQVDVLKEQLQASISTDDGARRSMVDPTVHRTCSDQSLKTMMEICVRCLLKDPLERPSIEDVLWNLQFASQVQEGWLHNSNPTSIRSSPSPAASSRLHITTLESPRDSGIVLNTRAETE